MCARSSSIVGMVTRNGNPIPGVLVSLCHRDREAYQQMYTDTKGAFSFAVPPGEWRVEVFCAEGARHKPILISPGESSYLHFDLTPRPYDESNGDS